MESACFSQPIFGRIIQTVYPKLTAGSAVPFLRNAVLLQTTLSGTALILLNLLAPVLVPLLWGSEWGEAVALLGPLSMAAFLAAPTLVLWQTLWAKADYHLVTIGNLARAGAVAAGTVLLLPSMGPIGYAWAEVVTAVVLLILPYDRWLPSGLIPPRLLAFLGIGAICFIHIVWSSPLWLACLLWYRHDLQRRGRNLLSAYHGNQT